VAVSNAEKRVMKKGRMVDVVPNGVDTGISVLEVQKEYNEKRVLFIGDFKWLQNIDAAENNFKTYLAGLKFKDLGSKKKTNVKLWIVGKNIPTNIKNLATV